MSFSPKYFIGVLVLMTCGSMFSCKSSKHTKYKRLPGVWQVTPITIDGSNKDWPSPYPEYDDKAALGYTVSNDKDNLYITVETGDPATQLKILKQGLTVWIDKTGGEDELTAINYPIPQPEDKSNKDADHPSHGQWQQGNGGSSSGSQDQMRMELEDKVRKLLPDANEFSLQGFKGCNMQFPIMEKDTCGITVRIGLDADNELVWEAVVPFKSFYYKPSVEKHDKGRALSVCFETFAAKRPAGQNNGNHGNGGGGGMRPSVGFGGMGMGMHMGGGGMNGGHNRNSAQNNNSAMMEPLYKSTKTWKKFGIGWQD